MLVGFNTTIDERGRKHLFYTEITPSQVKLSGKEIAEAENPLGIYKFFEYKSAEQILFIVREDIVKTDNVYNQIDIYRYKNEFIFIESKEMIECLGVKAGDNYMVTELNEAPEYPELYARVGHIYTDYCEKINNV